MCVNLGAGCCLWAASVMHWRFGELPPFLLPHPPKGEDDDSIAVQAGPPAGRERWPNVDVVVVVNRTALASHGSGGGPLCYLMA